MVTNLTLNRVLSRSRDKQLTHLHLLTYLLSCVRGSYVPITDRTSGNKGVTGRVTNYVSFVV